MDRYNLLVPKNAWGELGFSQAEKVGNFRSPKGGTKFSEVLKALKLREDEVRKPDNFTPEFPFFLFDLGDRSEKDFDGILIEGTLVVLTKYY